MECVTPRGHGSHRRREPLFCACKAPRASAADSGPLPTVRHQPRHQPTQTRVPLLVRFPLDLTPRRLAVSVLLLAVPPRSHSTNSTARLNNVFRSTTEGVDRGHRGYRRGPKGVPQRTTRGLASAPWRTSWTRGWGCHGGHPLHPNEALRATSADL